MSQTVPTVQIVTANGPVTINESDFNPEIHDLVHDPDSSAFVQPATAPAIEALATAPAIEALATAPVIEAPATAPVIEAPATAPVATIQKFVQKIGKSFFVVDDKGNKLTKNAHATEVDAWNEILTVNG